MKAKTLRRRTLIIAAIAGTATGSAAYGQTLYGELIELQTPMFFWRFNEPSRVFDATGRMFLTAELSNHPTAVSTAFIWDTANNGNVQVGQSAQWTGTTRLRNGGGYSGYLNTNTWFRWPSTGSATRVEALTSQLGVIGSQVGSVSYWFRTDSTLTNLLTTTTDWHLYQGDSGATGQLKTQLVSGANGGQKRFMIGTGESDGNPATDWLVMTTTGNYYGHDWHHVVVTWDAEAGTATMHIDGGDAHGGETVAVPYVLPEGHEHFTFTNRHQFGQGPTNQTRFRGDADDLAIWSRALSPTEAAAQYQMGKFGTMAYPRMHWNASASGEWSNEANWIGGVPSEVDAAANFIGVNAAAQTITLDGPQTVGSLVLNSGRAYTLTGEALTMATSAGPARIEAQLGHHVIESELSLSTDTEVHVGWGSNLTISGTVNSNSVDVVKSGQGTLHISHMRAESLSIVGGVVRIIPNGTPEGASDVGALTMAPGTTLDLTDNRITIRDGDVDEIYDLVLSGRAGGSWDGPGITSSLVASQGNRTIGVATNGSGVVVGMTYAGDANLDGAVNIADLGILAANWQRGVSGVPDARWYHGDFHYSGQVDIADLGILAANWQAGAGGSSTISFAEAMAMFDVFHGVVVPEPAGVGLLAMAGLLGFRRRR
jgi:MprA protease rhombosortase-interaction domain-containing protein